MYETRSESVMGQPAAANCSERFTIWAKYSEQVWPPQVCVWRERRRFMTRAEEIAEYTRCRACQSEFAVLYATYWDRIGPEMVDLSHASKNWSCLFQIGNLRLELVTPSTVRSLSGWGELSIWCDRSKPWMIGSTWHFQVRKLSRSNFVKTGMVIWTTVSAEREEEERVSEVEEAGVAMREAEKRYKEDLGSRKREKYVVWYHNRVELWR